MAVYYSLTKEDLFNRLGDGFYNAKAEEFITLSKLSEGHVEDNSKSNQWNLEFIKSNNDEYERQQVLFKQEQERLTNQLEADKRDAISTHFELSIEAAEKVVSYVYEKFDVRGAKQLFDRVEPIVRLFHDLTNETN